MKSAHNRMDNGNRQHQQTEYKIKRSQSYTSTKPLFKYALQYFAGAICTGITAGKGREHFPLDVQMCPSPNLEMPPVQQIFKKKKTEKSLPKIDKKQRIFR